MARWSWKDDPELMARLTKAQNDPANRHADIMTFAGFCGSRAELLAHVKRYEGAPALAAAN